MAKKTKENHWPLKGTPKPDPYLEGIMKRWPAQEDVAIPVPEVTKVIKPEERFRSEIDAATEEYVEKLEAIGEKIREEIIVPICKKRQFSFTAAMGTYFFWDERPGKQRSIHNVDAEQLNYKDVVEAYKILDIVGIQFEIGHYIRDFKFEPKK